VALNLWDLKQIRDKIRRLSGRNEDEQITDAELNTYINKYYQIVFPLESRPIELNVWFETTLTEGVDTYTLASLDFDDRYLTFDKPVTVNGKTIILYLNPNEFFNIYPENQEYDNGKPEAVLLYNNELVFRRPPDAIHINFKASALSRPQALVNDSDTPFREEWGALIAYGATIELLEDAGEIETIQIILPMYEKHKRDLTAKVRKQFENQRSIPKF
jgi:hypothetical protein